MNYTDAIAYLPTGRTGVVQEFVNLGMTQHILKMDVVIGTTEEAEDIIETQISIGNGIEFICTSSPDEPTVPAIAHIRMFEQVADGLAALNLTSVKLLAVAPSHGIEQETGEVVDDVPVTVKVDVYDLVAENPDARAVYESIIPPYPPYLLDDEGNPRQQTVTDENGIESMQPVPDHRAGKLRRMVHWG